MTPPEAREQKQAWPTGYLLDTKNDWFSRNIPVWKGLQFSSDSPTRVLEIGAFEGRSTTWLIEKKLKKGDQLHVLDTWEWESVAIYGQDATSQFESNFDHNVAVALERVPESTL